MTMAGQDVLSWVTMPPHSLERLVGGNHHRLVCRACGHTEDAGCVVGERSCLEPAGNHSFVIDAAEVVFWGLCPACQAKGAKHP